MNYRSFQHVAAVAGGVVFIIDRITKTVALETGTAVLNSGPPALPGTDTIHQWVDSGPFNVAAAVLAAAVAVWAVRHRWPSPWLPVAVVTFAAAGFANSVDRVTGGVVDWWNVGPVTGNVADLAGVVAFVAVAVAVVAHIVTHTARHETVGHKTG